MKSETYLVQLEELNKKSALLQCNKYFEVQRQIERTRERIKQLEAYERPSEKQNLFTICKVQAIIETQLDALLLDIIKR
jgi:hypothetical protein